MEDETNVLGVQIFLLLILDNIMISFTFRVCFAFLPKEAYQVLTLFKILIAVEQLSLRSTLVNHVH